MPYLVVACQVLSALTFLAAAAGKLRSRAAYAGFVAELDAWPLVPAGLRPAVARAVCAAEAAVPVLLAVPVTRRAGSALAALLLTAFLTAMILLRIRGTAARCTCFGRKPATLGARHRVRTTVLLGAAGAALLGQGVGGPATVGGGLIAAGFGALGALVAVTLDDIADTLGPVSAHDVTHTSRS
ncbi:MauE/DoxX family redox-associated membrane protein [Streptomyces sp. NPDC002809]|uniref:MauE/DoxX family redox-associated membrane protein n=1 Tax=Streptomyces sp. NPDC002809 TaxID=3154433 RepID=UPI00332180B7